ncbi:MAG: alpha/beta hydrolase [Paludibacteraceae bacterium]
MKKQTLHITCSDGHRMKILVYSPQGNDAGTKATGVLWIHGGGYFTGMASMAGFMGRAPSLVRKFGAVVVSPAYRLGKKGRYPNALNDCYDALKYMLLHAEELGINPNQIFVGGESAGGGLTAALCMLARDRQEVNIAFQMPLYPMIDDRDTESSKDNHNIGWNTRWNHFGWKIYLGPLYGTKDVPAYAAAARQQDFRNLPPAYTFVCTAEPFYCETMDFIAALQRVGIEAEVDVYDGLFHAFDMTCPWLDISRKAARRFETVFAAAQAKYFKENRIE